MASTSSALITQLKDALKLRYSLVPTDRWLDDFLSAGNHQSHPMPALVSTAHFRLSTSDFTTALVAHPPYVLPTTISEVQTEELKLRNDVPVQVLDIQDTSTSRWAQIEAIERVERGEEIRGREVIRNVPGIHDDDSDDNAQAGQLPTPTASGRASNPKKGSTGPHKLLLQDAAGTKVWAFELARIDKITIVNASPPLPDANGTTGQPQIDGMQIGCKIILKQGAAVRRGLVILTPSTVNVLSGKVEIWDKRWRETRKARLTQELETIAIG